MKYIIALLITVLFTGCSKTSKTSNGIYSSKDTMQYDLFEIYDFNDGISGLCDSIAIHNNMLMNKKLADNTYRHK